MNNCKKRFIPCIYLYHGTAVKGFDDYSVLSSDPAGLARDYAAADADELIVFDFSNTDSEHDEAIEKLREICASVVIPVTGAGNIRRMEDVKKILYAGAAKAALNFSKQTNIDLAEEVAAKFGRDRISACCAEADSILEYKELILANISEMILMDESSIRDALQIRDVSTVLNIPEVSLDKIIELLSYDCVTGITGKAINENCNELRAVKQLCAENGLNVIQHTAKLSFDDFKLGADGLLPVVVQEDSTNEVLMVAYMDRQAYEETIRTGRMHYYSRSRRKLWLKGETSGHFQYVRKLMADCDRDTLLARVDQIGAACHTGSHSCFFEEDLLLAETGHNPQQVLEDVYTVIEDRKIHPREGSYTNYLFSKGIDKMLKKLGEENAEIIIAAKNPGENEIIYEFADYLYHMMVVMSQKGVTWSDITEELARRETGKES